MVDLGALGERYVRDEPLDTMLAGPGRSTDLVESLAFPLPMSVICELLGVHFLDRRAFRAWSNTALSSIDGAARRAVTAEVSGYLAGLLDGKRAQPGDDLMSALIHTADEEGDRLSGDELMGMAWLLLVAGHETTVNLISHGVLALLTTRGSSKHCGRTPPSSTTRWRRCSVNAGPVETPTHRFTTGPLDIGGTVIPGGGELVLIAMADALRDPDRYPDADRFDITRDARGHVAFGHGIHYCLGAPPARVEAAVAIGSLLERCPELALDTDPDALT